MIRIKVNGKEWKVHPETTAADLLSKMKISSKTCVVEKNGEIVERVKIAKTVLADGDQIEIIRMMGGG